MALDTTVTGDEVSASVAPVAGNSLFIIEPGTGTVFLEIEQPTSGLWFVMGKETGGHIIITPDLAVSYRFRAANVTTPRRVYFGA